MGEVIELVNSKNIEKQINNLLDKLIWDRKNLTDAEIKSLRKEVKVLIKKWVGLEVDEYIKELEQRGIWPRKHSNSNL